MAILFLMIVFRVGILGVRYDFQVHFNSIFVGIGVIYSECVLFF